MPTPQATGSIPVATFTASNSAASYPPTHADDVPALPALVQDSAGSAPTKTGAGRTQAPIYGADLPRTVAVTDLFEMVQIFRQLPPRSRTLRDQFFDAYKHIGGRRYVYSLLQPFLDRKREDPRNGHVNPTTLAVAHKVAEEKIRLYGQTAKMPSTELVLSVLQQRGELAGVGELSYSYVNTIIRKRHLMRDLYETPSVRVGCPGVRFCDFADSTGSMVLKLRNDGRVEIGPAIDSRYLKNHQYEYAGRRSVYYVTFVDQYSGYVYGDIVTINNSGEAARIAREFWGRCGKPQWVNVDRGSEFKSVFKLFCELNDIGFQPRGLRNKRAGGKVETVNLRIQTQFEMELLGVRGLGAILSLDEAREAFRTWQRRWNGKPSPRDSVKSRASLCEVPGHDPETGVSQDAVSQIPEVPSQTRRILQRVGNGAIIHEGEYWELEKNPYVCGDAEEVSVVLVGNRPREIVFASGARAGILGRMTGRTGEEFRRWDKAEKARENGARNLNGARAVRAVRIEDGFSVEYRSINEAARELNIASTKICEVLRGRDSKGRNTYSAKGFTFGYAEDRGDPIDLKISQARINQGRLRRVVAVHLNGDRRIFESSKEVSKTLGVAKGSVSKFLTGRTKYPVKGWVLAFEDD